jgi:hypothetical protein
VEQITEHGAGPRCPLGIAGRHARQQRAARLLDVAQLAQLSRKVAAALTGGLRDLATSPFRCSRRRRRVVPASRISVWSGVAVVGQQHGRRLPPAGQPRDAGHEPTWARSRARVSTWRSGYVRVLQEMIAAGWSYDAVARQVLALLTAWFDVLLDVAREAENRFGPLGPFRAEDIAGLIGLSFLGGEALILLGDEHWGRQVRVWLHSVADLIRQYEEG